MLGGCYQWESPASPPLSTAVVPCLSYNSCMSCVLGLQSHQIAPWSWIVTKVEGLGWLGMGEIILLMLWLCQSQLQTDLCSLTCKNIGGWSLGRGTEGLLLDGLLHVSENLFVPVLFLPASLSCVAVCVTSP